MGGYNQINYQCQRQAMKTNLHGIFRALHLVPEKILDFEGKQFTNLNNISLNSGGKLYSFNGKDVGMSERYLFI